MKLTRWIKLHGGNVKAAPLLGVARNNCYAWCEGVALPRPEIMKRIVTVTKGKVSYAEMVEEYLELHPALVARRAKAKPGKRKPKKKTAGF